MLDSITLLCAIGEIQEGCVLDTIRVCLLYTSPSPRDRG